jgi:enoyl-CoA hydratase/carnithine racemase
VPLQGRAFSAGGDFSFIEERMAASAHDNEQASSGMVGAEATQYGRLHCVLASHPLKQQQQQQQQIFCNAHAVAHL